MKKRERFGPEADPRVKSRRFTTTLSATSAGDGRRRARARARDIVPSRVGSHEFRSILKREEREREEKREIFLRVWLRLVSGFDSSRWSYNLQPPASQSFLFRLTFRSLSLISSRFARVALPSAALAYDRARKQTLVPKPASIAT